MKHRQPRLQRALTLARCFQRSRLEEKFLATAYALVLPILRQPCPARRTAGRHRPKPINHELSDLTEEDLRA